MRNYLIIMSLCFVLMLGHVSAHAPVIKKIDNVSTEIEQNLTDSLTSFINQEDSILLTNSQKISQALFDEVLAYISHTSKIDKVHKEAITKRIIELALDNDIDICFILAQATNETQIGTAGIGRTKSRHSLFGVYKYYKSYDDCINDYVKILKKSYLTRGRTWKDLMNRYVTTGGARYAEDRSYEAKLKQRRSEIVKKYNILSLQNEYKEAKDFEFAEEHSSNSSDSLVTNIDDQEL